MNRIRTVALAVMFGLLPYGAMARQAPPPMPGVPMPGAPMPGGPAPSPGATGTGICTIRGQVLAPVDFGVAAGEPVADASAVRLEDGRIRLYAFAQRVGIVSAISLTAEGLTFVPEEGTRLPNGTGMSRMVAVPGGWRSFYMSGNGIKSAVSADGLTFTPEPGFRITAEAAGFGDTTVAATSGATVVALADGGFRMYFSDLPRPGDPPGNHRIKSAISTDMLSWTVEDGVRIGPGAPVLTESAEHPFALANPDGSVTLYYGKFTGPGSASPEGTYQSTSADGLTFEQETLSVFFGNDPDAVRLDDGTLALYFGLFDHQVGGTVNVAYCPDPVAAR
jgi:hypothetical protein